MKFLLKQLKYVVLLVIFLLVLTYATLLPKPYKVDIATANTAQSEIFEGSFKLITFNLGLLDLRVVGRTMFKPTEYIEQRAKIIPKQLLTHDADVIALQEIYDKKHIDFFVKELQKTYPFYFFKHNSQIKLNNGLMIFSKYPFVSTKGESQSDKGPIDEWFIADRGLLSAVIKLNDEINLDIVNLHATSGGTLNSQDSDNINASRQKQLEQALTLALASNTEYQIILGDVNAGPEISNINYNYLLENDFSDAYAEYSLQKGIVAKPTWDGANPLNSMRGYTAEDTQRIDHIYLSKRLGAITQLEIVERVFDENVITIDGKGFPLSDHYGVEMVLRF